VFADVYGNIGFTIPALIPIRAGALQGLPVPGDTDDFEWKGYIPFEELPRALNPATGIIATANARTVGPGYKYFVSERWAGPFRTERIYEILAARKGWHPGDLNAAQNDIVTLPDQFLAKQLVTAAKTKPPQDPRAQQLVARLAAWDGRALTVSV